LERSEEIARRLAFCCDFRSFLPNVLGTIGEKDMKNPFEKRFINAALALFICCAVTSSGWARARSQSDLAKFIRANYTKSSYFIPMRDGVRLFTFVYAPKDTNRLYPIMMLRTPYSIAPYKPAKYPDELGPSEAFAREGFIFVYQDVRGRYRSEGLFIDMPPHKTHLSGPQDTDESTDACDSINWLVKHIPNNNGRVGLWGVSYDGFYAAHGMLNAPPALKAASPQAPMADAGDGDDMYHNGAFFLAANFDFYMTDLWPRGPKLVQNDREDPDFDYGTRDHYAFFLRMGPLANAEALYFRHRNSYWSNLLKHPNYDEFWTSRALGPVMHDLTAPVLVVGGWFDAEDLGGTLKLFHAIDQHGGAPAVTLVMGPWSHGQWDSKGGAKLGKLSFGSKTCEFYHERIEFPFFAQALASHPKDSVQLPKAWLFETGKNEWCRFDSWPPKDALRRTLYFQAGGKLLFDPPAEKSATFDQYVGDPANPVPLLAKKGEGMPDDYMTGDQRFATRRPDVLTYETDPLKDDLTVAGPITPRLRVSTSGTDSDFIVKLIDVYPDDAPDPVPNPKGIHYAGYQQLVRGEPFRGKFRNSRSEPQPFVPGQPARIEFSMPDVLHQFRKGHRIMVQIQSSWFPLVDRNPQQFEDIPTAKASDFQKAVERVYCGGGEGTRIEVLTIAP
jgi:uncharacterized protein